MAKQVESKDKKPYFVEQDASGCKQCGNGKTWYVVNPDGIGDDTSYGEKEEAQDLAQKLNEAFQRGKQDCPLPDAPQPAASPWLPMEQAPKDGMYLLVKYVRGNGTIFYDVVCWTGNWWKNIDGQGRTWIPDAFAYINPPPKENA